MKTTKTTTILSLPLAYLCAGILAGSGPMARGQDRGPAPNAPAARAQRDTSKKAAAPAKVDLEYLFQQLDTNNDGKVTREEFNGLATMLASLVAPPVKEGDKTKSEVSGVAKVSAGSVTGLNDPDGLFRKLDVNGDGKLSLEEFKKFGPSLESASAPQKADAAGHDHDDAAKKPQQQQKKDEADKGTNLPDVGSGGSSSGARDSATGR